MHRPLVIALPLAALLSLAPPASAQITQKARETSARSDASPAPRLSEIDGAKYKVEFDDDLLAGVPLDGTVPILRIRIIAGHSPLLRPRASFVRELKKSVEAI